MEHSFHLNNLFIYGEDVIFAIVGDYLIERWL